MRTPYPFSAIVGQDEMKLALVLAAIDPTIGGVLIFGDRGTGKSTAVRGLAELLPKMKKVTGCRFNCDPAAVEAYRRALALSQRVLHRENAGEGGPATK